MKTLFFWFFRILGIFFFGVVAVLSIEPTVGFLNEKNTMGATIGLIVLIASGSITIGLVKGAIKKIRKKS